MSHFAGIIPCGIRDKGVTSMAAQLGQPPTVDQVKPIVQTALGEVLEVSWKKKSYQQLESALDVSRVG
jgi:lipoyl(octanoyl) transferase